MTADKEVQSTFDYQPAGIGHTFALVIRVIRVSRGLQPRLAEEP